MNYRKINSHIILLAIVIVVGLLVAMVARLMVLGQGVDAGTANLTFVIVLGVCAVVYLIIMSVFSHTIIPLVIRKLPETKRPAVETEAVPSIDNMPVMNVEQIKQDADRQFAERRKEKIELFLRYAHRTIGPYVTSDELVRLDRCVEYYGREEACPADFVPIRPEKLKKCGSVSFWMEHGSLFRTAETGCRAVAKSRIYPFVRLGRFLYQRETAGLSNREIRHS